MSSEILNGLNLGGTPWIVNVCTYVYVPSKFNKHRNNDCIETNYVLILSDIYYPTNE